VVASADFSVTLHSQLAVVGGGPGGLRAAEVAALAGVQVTLYEGKPSVGRKFLVAGRGGLNLTHGGPRERFALRYSGPGQPAELWTELLADFDPAALRRWAAELSVATFQATSWPDLSRGDEGRAAVAPLGNPAARVGRCSRGTTGSWHWNR
jgi:phytoene dehydrogenase-like protein